MSKIEAFEGISNKKSFFIKAKPNARETKIISYDAGSDEYLVDVAARAEDNLANIEIIKYFSRLSGKRAKIKSGLTSKRKHIILE